MEKVPKYQRLIKDYQRLDDLSKDIFDLKEGLEFNLEKANNLTEVQQVK